MNHNNHKDTNNTTKCMRKFVPLLLFIKTSGPSEDVSILMGFENSCSCQLQHCLLQSLLQNLKLFALEGSLKEAGNIIDVFSTFKKSRQILIHNAIAVSHMQP